MGLEMLAKAAQHAGPPLLSSVAPRRPEEPSGVAVSRAQDAMVRSYVSLTNQGLADGHKTTNFL